MFTVCPYVLPVTRDLHMCSCLVRCITSKWDTVCAAARAPETGAATMALDRNMTAADVCLLGCSCSRIKAANHSMQGGAIGPASGM
eukprot:748451-Pelagomonas_calceolata.AAC.1